MSLAILGELESSSLQPIKRRRGRPSKDSYLKPPEAAFISPGSNGVKQYHSQTSNTKYGADSMLGQSVTGFVEGTFDAGYLLSVRIGNSNTILRGLLFKPGCYVPVTAVNDVAPHLPMIQRSDMSFTPGNLSLFQGRGLAFSTESVMLPVKRKYAVASAPRLVEGNAVVQSPANISTGINTDTPMADSIMPPDECAPVNLMMEQQDNGQPLTAVEIHTLKSPKLKDVKFEQNNTVTSNSRVLPVQESQRSTEPLETQEHVSSFTLTLSCPAGRMPELLQAVEYNTTESQMMKTVEVAASMPEQS